jgi:hypothetical protein
MAPGGLGSPGRPIINDAGPLSHKIQNLPGAVPVSVLLQNPLSGVYGESHAIRFVSGEVFDGGSHGLPLPKGGNLASLIKVQRQQLAGVRELECAQAGDFKSSRVHKIAGSKTFRMD